MSLKVGHTYIAEVYETKPFRKIEDIQKGDLITFLVESETEKTVDLSIGDSLIRITRTRFDSSVDMVEDLGDGKGIEAQQTYEDPLIKEETPKTFFLDVELYLKDTEPSLGIVHSISLPDAIKELVEKQGHSIERIIITKL